MYSILLVDDEPLALRGNKIIIERSGLDALHLYEAEDGLEALKVLREHPVDLAARTGFSTSYFSQIFKEKTGKSYVQFRTELRIRKAKELLVWSDMSITDIAMEVGYNDSTYFIRVFKEYTGQTPNAYKKNREAG